MADAQTQAGGTPEAGANGGGTPSGASGQQPSEGAKGGTPETPEVWLAKQDESTQDMIEKLVLGLKSTVTSLRDDLKKRIRDDKAHAKTLEEGSAAKAELDKRIASDVEKDLKLAFYEDADSKGISDKRLAFLAARDADLIDEKGRVDFEELKKRHPGLFSTQRPAIPPGHAGAGVGTASSSLSGPASINAAIRRAAGIR